VARNVERSEGDECQIADIGAKVDGHRPNMSEYIAGCGLAHGQLRDEQAGALKSARCACYSIHSGRFQDTALLVGAGRGGAFIRANPDAGRWLASRSAVKQCNAEGLGVGVPSGLD
jgi:hypothetical protein